jgi:hypothetical protein
MGQLVLAGGREFGALAGEIGYGVYLGDLVAFVVGETHSHVLSFVVLVH